jgi:hypothetical protein
MASDLPLFCHSSASKITLQRLNLRWVVFFLEYLHVIRYTHCAY